VHSPTEKSPVPCRPVGAEGGRSSLAALGFAELKVPVEWPRFCPVCLSKQNFIGQIEVGNGLFGCCSNCGDERVAPWTRTTWEAA